MYTHVCCGVTLDCFRGPRYVGVGTDVTVGDNFFFGLNILVSV